jgi:enoyl-CoA hydratase/carnithine racemase
MVRLARLVWHGRAAEILLGADDFPAALAAQNGYVNRVLPDAELVGARRCVRGADRRLRQGCGRRHQGASRRRLVAP